MVDIQHIRDHRVATIRLTGDLDLAAEDQLNSALAALLADNRPDQVTIDLGGVEFCDSSGIRILVRALHLGQAVDVPVRVTRACDRVAEVLKLTGVWSLLTSQPQPDSSNGAAPSGPSARANGHLHNSP